MSELLEKILSRDNMNLAYKKVCANKGAGGVDEVTVEELGEYIKENWESIREQIRRREYKPQPVRRVEIPKPSGGVRKLETKRRSEKTRNPYRNGQGNSARNCAGHKPYV